MALRGLLALAAVIHGVQVNDAATVETNEMAAMQKLRASMRLRVKSKESIMAHMTKESATKVVLGMNETHEHPELVALLESKFGSRLQQRAMLRSRSQSRMSVDEEGNVSKSMLQEAGQKNANAKKMLNTMIMEASEKLELNEFKCHNFEEKQMGMMESTRQDVLSFNSQAAEARGQVLKAEANIGILNIKLPKVREELAAHNKQCEVDITAIKASLKIILADIEVMAGILKLVNCPKFLLMQCSHCGGAVLIQHGGEDDVQRKLDSLQSKVAKMYTAQNLHQAYLEAEQRSPVSFFQEEESAGRLWHVVGHSQKGHASPLNTSDAPEKQVVQACVPNNRCTIGGANCKKLRDRFLVIQAAIVDKKNQLSQELVETETFCESATKEMEGSINVMEESLKEQQTNLAVGTKDQNDAESGSHLKSEQHATLLAEYKATMTECCDDTNELKSEICALEKIRGEVDKLSGAALYTTDCELSDWREEECTVTCGGGVMRKTRAVIVQPTGDGTPCLPLQAEMVCNTMPCPVDCITEDWGGWSSCSAQCGGGVRERSRSIRVEPENDGNPCEATEESEPCAMQSCDADCQLSDWNDWGACSKACDSGMHRRQKKVLSPARGTGSCVEVESPEMLEFKSCNDFPCEDLLENGTKTLTCQSKVDIVLMIDGSGSLGQTGWDQSILAAKSIIKSLNGSDDKVKVAVQLFSGPSTWDDYYACTGASDPTVKVDMSKQCGITWVEHFTTDTTKLATTVEGLAWPSASTLTSVALGEAEAELMYGRADANAVVVVITDGWPMSPYNTRTAAAKLKEKASVIWVPVGANAPLDLIKELASLPQTDHIVRVTNFQDLENPSTINKVISDACPIVSR